MNTFESDKKAIRVTHPIFGMLIVPNVSVSGQGQVRLTNDKAESIAQAWVDAPTEGDTVRSYSMTPSGDIAFNLHQDSELTTDYWEVDETLGVFLLKDAPLDGLKSTLAPVSWPILQSIIDIVTNTDEPGSVWKFDAIVNALAESGLIISDTDGIRVAVQ